MQKSRSNRGQGSVPVDIRAQLDALHNPTFPFSSPMVDNHESFRPQSLDTTTEHSFVFASPDPSMSAYTDITSGDASEQDEFHLERYSEGKNMADKSKGSTILSGSKRKGAPGLQLVTDFSKLNPNTKNLLFDRVSAKRAEHSRNRARSIVSQKGVRVSNSFPSVGNHGELSIRIQNPTPNLKRSVGVQPINYFNPPHEHGEHSPSRRSVMIGLCVSEYEAEIHHRNGVPQSAITLVTPITPAIVVTPPDANVYQMRADRQECSVNESQRRPASSMYSTVIFQHGAMPNGTALPPMPSIPVQHSIQTKILQSRNPYRNIPQAQVGITEDDSDIHQRMSEDSKEHILQSSSETPRPKSQGWWNVLSPLLSRASSLASRKGRDAADPVPPVPPLPMNLEKQTPTSAAYSTTSPETPRRQGLAIVRDSTWSRWTEWEAERELAQGHRIGLEEKDLAQEKSTDPEWSGVNSKKHGRSNEGLAAEYYHACAIEQLAGISYFECVNHSCSERLPHLRSIHDAPEKATFSLGSPFVGNLGSKTDTIDHIIEKENVDLVTPIDSDDDEDDLQLHGKRGSISKRDVWSPTTESDEGPDELSPNVRKANTAAVVRARALGSPEKSPTPLPLYSKAITQKAMPNIAAVAAVKPEDSIPSPHALSPDAQKPLAPAGGIPMMHYNQPIAQLERVFITNQTSYPELPVRHAVAPITIADLRPMHQIREAVEDRRVQNEKEDARARRAGGLWRGRGCIPQSGCFGRSGREGRQRRRWWLCITLVLTMIIITCIVLATTLTRRGNGTPVQSQWLNLTGYPPIPTGISTIARPSLTKSENRCMSPTTMWSCALPKEDQASVSPNDPNQPNLRFQITFRNGTVPANMTIPLMKRADDPFTNSLFTPNPSPPSQADQIFLGRTTDNTTRPYDGEQTPFFITFMSASPALPPAFNASQKFLLTRDISSNIPAPALAADGSAAPATLLPTNPFPVSQPVKLYNRGLQDEHFGFYMYYDKSIFLANIAITNSSAANKTANDPNADQNGGSLKAVANVRCTFSQTRFLVKMFTNRRFGGSLLPQIQNLTATTPPKQTANSSATNFSRPGSFPYPTTIILDRHGGDLNSKLVYCYGMTNGQIDSDEKQLAFEQRDFGGVLINPAPGLIDDGTSTFNSSAGGIDGGTGGCGCTWQNWS